MKRYAIVNQKGGVGKTTTALNLAAGLSAAGRSVLLIDLDGQAHLTAALGLQPDELTASALDWMQGNASAADVTYTTAIGPSLIPANADLAAADILLAQEIGREKLLRQQLAKVRGFDYVLIDCPPSLGLLTLNALVAADRLLIPCQVEPFALRGVGQLEQTIAEVRKKLNPRLQVAGVIGTRFDARKVLNRDVAAALREHFTDKLFMGTVRENIAIAEAPSWGKSIFAYRPNSTGAADYAALVHKLEREKP